jgi:hypothetical protein
MESTACFGISRELPSLSINLTRVLQIGLEAFCVIVRINEVIARVVRRVNVNHLDFAKISLLKNFENFEVVTFNDHVLSGVPIDTFVLNR